MDPFHYFTYEQEVAFGPGSLGRLTGAVERIKVQRLLLCTSHSIRLSGHITPVETALGNCLAAEFDHVLPHVQDVQVNEVLALAVEKNVDAVLGMGGGSPIGMAKAVASALNQSPKAAMTRISYPAGRLDIPVIAIPTTYAGSEMTPFYGITHTDVTPARKATVSDPKAVPKLVIYDPELTLDLPQGLTASTGINALAHCIEALYSITRNPLSTAAAISGVQHISNSLLRCYQRGNDLEARTEMLLGAHLAGISIASVSMGLHHGLCHVLGGSANIPHGVANSIVLPHAIRFNADVAARELLPAAEAMGIPGNGSSPLAVIEALRQYIYELVKQMELPQRLRDAGVKESDLPQLAQLGFQNRTVQNNPKPVNNAAQIEQLLRDAW